MSSARLKQKHLFSEQSLGNKQVIDSRCLNAIVYSRAVPERFLHKYLLTKLSDDGAEVLEEYINTPKMASTEVWDLLHRDDRDKLNDFLTEFGRHKWKWILVMADGEELAWTQKEHSHSRKDG